MGVSGQAGGLNHAFPKFAEIEGNKIDLKSEILYTCTANSFKTSSTTGKRRRGKRANLHGRGGSGCIFAW